MGRRALFSSAAAFSGAGLSETEAADAEAYCAHVFPRPQLVLSAGVEGEDASSGVQVRRGRGVNGLSASLISISASLISISASLMSISARFDGWRRARFLQLGDVLSVRVTLRLRHRPAANEAEAAALRRLHAHAPHMPHPVAEKWALLLSDKRYVGAVHVEVPTYGAGIYIDIQAFRGGGIEIMYGESRRG